MDFTFDRHHIPVEQRANLPLEVPAVRHPSRGGWVNHGIALYQEIFGADQYAKYSQRQFATPMPRPSLRGRAGLALMLARAKLMFASRTLFTGRRGTHTYGVAARGHIEIVAAPAFPEHEFFVAGRRFGCRLRHANASFADDAVCQVRGCSLKFADADVDSPYDLLMNTGSTAAFWSLESFMAFADARVMSLALGPLNDWGPQKQWFRRWPAAYVGTIESVRALPSSYADLSYYTKIAYPFWAKDGRRRYAKYRILRPDLEHESGQPNMEEQRRAWWQSRVPGDDRPRRALAGEFEQRVRGGLEYRLQIQLWDWDDQRDSAEVLNLCRCWDEDAHPWLDLARVTLTAPLSEAETAVTKMWLGHQPPSLGVSDAHCAQQYSSLPWARVHVYPVSQRNRRRG